MKSTREKILETSYGLFVKNSYKSVSMNMIAGELGISKPALYHYFKSKEDLFMEIFTTAAMEFKARVQELVKEDMKPDEKIYNFIIAHSEFFIKHNSVLFLMMQKLSEKDEDMIKAMDKFRYEILNFLEPLVGKLTKKTKKESKIYTLMILGMIGSLAKESFCGNQYIKLTPKETAQRIMDVMFKEFINN